LAGYLDDPTVALVQSPHDFYNHDSAQHYELGRHEQSVFYSVILPGKDRHGAAFWCGSAALIRRSALMDIGGVATDTIAEDFHTTIKLQRHGWGTRYHDEVLVQGLAPHDLDSYLLQRDRWARGNLAVFTTPESPLRARELTVQQRLSYFASLAAYLAGPARALMIVVLAAVVWTGALPMHATALTLGVLWLPQIALGLLAAQALGRGFNRMAESVHFELCTAEIHLRALRCIVRPGRTPFKVTPQEGVDLGGWRAVRKLELAVLLTVALGLGLVLRAGHALGWMPFPTLPGLAAWVVPIVAVVELRRCARTLYLVGRRRQRRAEYRVSTQLDAVLAVGEHEGPVRLVDLAVSGVGFESAVPFAIGMPATMKVELPLVVDGARHVQLPIEVRSCRPSGSVWFVGARMTEPSPGARDAVIEYCHVVYPFRRLRGRPSVDLLTVPADAWRDLFPAPHASMRVAPAAA
jgi:cellulose synthase (UDP-forming)